MKRINNNCVSFQGFAPLSHETIFQMLVDDPMEGAGGGALPFIERPDVPPTRLCFFYCYLPVSDWVSIFDQFDTF